jgi:hypothetical protein
MNQIIRQRILRPWEHDDDYNRLKEYCRLNEIAFSQSYGISYLNKIYHVSLDIKNEADLIILKLTFPNIVC